MIATLYIFVADIKENKMSYNVCLARNNARVCNGTCNGGGEKNDSLVIYQVYIVFIAI